MELWGGIECTINRVENKYFDQLEFSGHYHRDDLNAVCDTGIKKIRYPILWEKHQPAEGSSTINWDFTDRQLSILRERNVDVIAGLVHHGSGPAFTNMADENFPQLLAEYAGKVAERYPYIKYYTPVNEPLTTARFSGLYGLWYPHKSNDASFIKMLLNQLKGVVLSMREIRKINPEAQLIQTEDLGKTYSTPTLQYQARFENSRRWLTFDILCGRLNENHPMWKYFTRHGITKEELYFFIDNPCVPDVFGFNYYATSERFLDNRISRYPGLRINGNGLHKYADVEAVRVELDEPHGLSVLLTEAWKRFKQPIAITEVHLHCHREEQQRWFVYVLDQCKKAIEKGADIRAVTSWAMLGSWGWSKLLTKGKGTYEPGIFDLRNGDLRPTAMFSFLKSLSENNLFTHPLAKGAGWWERRQRFLYRRNQKGLHPEELTGGAVLLAGFDSDTTAMLIKALKVRNNKGLVFCCESSDCIDAETTEHLIEEGIISAVIYNMDNEKIFSRNFSFPNRAILSINKLCTAKKVKQVCIASSPVPAYSSLRPDVKELLMLLSESANAQKGTNFIHAAIDLIIDDEKGIWKFNSKNRFFRKVQEADVFSVQNVPAITAEMPVINSNKILYA